eukprot:g213.t1
MADSKFEQRFEQMEAGLNNADNAMFAVGVGGAVVGAVGSRVAKVAPEGITKGVKRQRSKIKKVVMDFQDRHPKMFWVGNFAYSVVNLGLYFLDVYTDVILCVTFYDNGHFAWFAVMATCIALPYLVAWLGTGVYLTKEREWKWALYLALTFVCPVFALAPLFFDFMMPFYRLFSSYLPGGLVVFMAQYEALRTLSEALLESLPQTILQLYIYFRCAGNMGNCSGITPEAGDVLFQSLIVSFVSIGFRVAQVYFETKKEKLSLKGYLKLLMEMGAGIPLRAITNNTVDTLNVSFALQPAQVTSLASALGHNRSIHVLDLSGCNVDDEGCRLLAASIRKMTGLREVDMSENNFGPVGARDLGDAVGGARQYLSSFRWRRDVRWERKAAKWSLCEKRLGAKDLEMVAGLVQGMRELNSLDLSQCEIDDEGCRIIAKGLVNVIGRGPATKMEKAAMAFDEFGLKELNVFGNAFGEDGANALAPYSEVIGASVPGWRQDAKVLDVSGRGMVGGNVYIVGGILLPAMAALEKLDLGKCGLDDKACAVLANALPAVTGLKEHGIDGHFDEILGSPITKDVHLERIFTELHTNIAPEETLFIGDGFTDFKTARKMNTHFCFLKQMTDWKNYEQDMGSDIGNQTICDHWDDVLGRIDC